MNSYIPGSTLPWPIFSTDNILSPSENLNGHHHHRFKAETLNGYHTHTLSVGEKINGHNRPTEEEHSLTHSLTHSPRACTPTKKIIRKSEDIKKNDPEEPKKKKKNDRIFNHLKQDPQRLWHQEIGTR